MNTALKLRDAVHGIDAVPWPVCGLPLSQQTLIRTTPALESLSRRGPAPVLALSVPLAPFNRAMGSRHHGFEDLRHQTQSGVAVGQQNGARLCGWIAHHKRSGSVQPAPLEEGFSIDFDPPTEPPCDVIIQLYRIKVQMLSRRPKGPASLATAPISGSTFSVAPTSGRR